ncbi:RNA exonuclease 1 homolog isoform X2 [Hoplias malabaricus]|uniref:RNA exonuclease 1 homolog isoform X2 n=1 Tax=Hoplias malabaricus TaxID=27720 RepID=UPI0034631839
MFPSAALFAEIDCPFLLWGRCERPYCQYKHTKEDGSLLSVCSRAAATGHGDHSTTSRAFGDQEESNTCLMELERINKQIEAVRNEVEKEQKRLSRYQSEQAENTTVTSEKYRKSRQTVSKDHNGNHIKHKKTVAAASNSSDCKYVVDRSRPKTDLEYDPCSNYSSDLRSGSSKDKMKSTNKKDVECHQKAKGKGMHVDPVLLPSCSVDDSDDDDVLVIDVPPLELNRQHSRPQKKSIATSEDPVYVENVLGSKGLSRKCTDNIKVTEHSLESLNPDIPSLDKNKENFGGLKDIVNKVKSYSPERNRIDIPDQQSNTGTKDCIPLKLKVTSEGVFKPELRATEDEQKSSVQYMSASEGPQSTKRMDFTDIENDQKKQSLDSTKAKEDISKHTPTLTKSSLVSSENAGPSVMASSPESVPTNHVNLDCFEEREHNIENVLDNISICLDHLRNESESIPCLPDVDSFLDSVGSVPDCSKIDRELFPQSTISVVQSMDAVKAVTDVQNSLSGCAQRVQTLPLKKAQQALQERMVFQDYFPTTSSFPAMTKEPGAGQNALTTGEASFPPAQKVLAEPAVQKVPVYISGTDTGHVPSAQSMKLHNHTATSQDLTLGQVQQKLPSSVISGIARGIPSQTYSAALMDEANNVIEIESSSSEELNYSDLDLSESDPMEECYKIFMEANGAENPSAQCDVPEEVPQMPEAEESAKPPPAQKKRVAHVAKFEVSKSKAQVIVPLRDGGSKLPIPTRSQQCQKKATALTAAVKGCQPFIAANVSKRVFTPTVISPSPVSNTFVNILPVGTTLRLGSNLHLIVPEGNCALPVTLIPATVPVTRPLHQPIQNLQPAQPANFTPAKSIPTKRKAKSSAEVGVKVPHDVRQRYVNLFVEEFLKTSATVQDAFEKALAEEKTVFDRSVNKLKYLSIAVNALKRLKNQNAAPAKFSCERDAQASRGNVPLNTQALLGNGDVALYDQMKEHILTEAMLRENNYPRQHPDKPGFAIQYGDTKKGNTDAFRKICCRCGTTFSISQTGKHTRKEECNYHYGKVIENRVPGGVETRYSCCENAVGAPGCQVFKLHVHDAVSLHGFVSSLPKTEAGCPGIYAVDTVMCYTTHGLELVRVTVVNSSLQVIYDTFVKPNNEVIDYNTRFSGVSEDDVKGSNSSLKDVQAVLLSFISTDTILVGHGLENDLSALKLLHSTVVDTSVVFPHRLGPPHKRELNSLTAEYLRRIIQESVGGHDSREDAVACMELMLWKVKEDAKVKRW